MKKPPLILIVEDDRNLGRVMIHLLEKAGYRTRLASDSLEAVTAARQEAPDLVLMDVLMPGIPGSTAAALIRETAGLGETRVVLVTSVASPWIQRHLDESGAIGYLQKPFRQDQLLHAVEEGLSECRGTEVNAWSPR